MRCPKIQSVQALDNHHLLVSFDNAEKRDYDVNPLMQRPMFAPLKSAPLFKSVVVETGGFAVVWNDAIDISEYELWAHGTPVK